VRTYRKKRDSDKDDTPSSPAWMTTYGDMMTLLMTFFILIMSFATIEVDKFKAAMGSLRGAFGVLGDREEVHSKESWFSPYQANIKKQSVLEDVEKLRDLIEQNQLQNIVEIYAYDTEVLIRIKDMIMFELGSAELKASFLPILHQIVATLNVHALEFKVVGHTDDLPIHTERYPSNWELSIDRALSVVRYMVKEAEIDPARLSAAGHSQYRPVVPNISPANRAMNRRVEIHVKL